MRNLVGLLAHALQIADVPIVEDEDVLKEQQRIEGRTADKEVINVARCEKDAQTRKGFCWQPPVQYFLLVKALGLLGVNRWRKDENEDDARGCHLVWWMNKHGQV